MTDELRKAQARCPLRATHDAGSPVCPVCGRRRAPRWECLSCGVRSTLPYENAHPHRSDLTRTCSGPVTYGRAR